MREIAKLRRFVKTGSDGPVSHLVVSWVLMIPLICFASSGILWPRAENDELGATYGVLAGGHTYSADNIAITLLLFAITPMLLFPRMKSIIELCREHIVFAVLAAWIMISVLWSQFPMVSLEWAPVAALNIAFAFYLYQRFSPDQQMRLLLLLGWLCLVLSVVASLFVPRYSVDYAGAWRGIYPQKNMCSMGTALLLLPALYAPAKGSASKLFRVAYVCLSGFLIIMTQSVTGKITLACLFVYFVASKIASHLRSEDRTIVLGLGTMIGVAFAGAGISNAKEISLLLGKDPTLTGRTEIWQAMIPFVMRHPIVGYGYKAFWRGYVGESAHISLATHWAVSSAHNGFLEIWLTLGAVGLALVVYSLLRAIRDAFVCLSAGKSPHVAWYASIIFLTFLTSLDEGELVIPNSLMWILYVLACVGLSEEARRIRLGLDCG